MARPEIALGALSGFRSRIKEIGQEKAQQQDQARTRKLQDEDRAIKAQDRAQQQADRQEEREFARTEREHKTLKMEAERKELGIKETKAADESKSTRRKASNEEVLDYLYKVKTGMPPSEIPEQYRKDMHSAPVYDKASNRLKFTYVDQDGDGKPEQHDYDVDELIGAVEKSLGKKPDPVHKLGPDSVLTDEEGNVIARGPKKTFAPPKPPTPPKPPAEASPTSKMNARRMYSSSITKYLGDALGYEYDGKSGEYNVPEGQTHIWDTANGMVSKVQTKYEETIPFTRLSQAAFRSVIDMPTRERAQAMAKEELSKGRWRDPDEADVNVRTEEILAKARLEAQARFNDSLAEIDAEMGEQTKAVVGGKDPNAAKAEVQGGSLPPEVVKRLKEGVATKFKNGQTWTLKGGKPVQVQ